MPDIELWGGHEYTVNRLGDDFCDQTILSGHHARPDDLERFAALGLQALRYPLLWERTAPDAPDRLDWRWSDDRLARIRGLGMRPIAGLLHHGSGPRYTNLLDEGFAQAFAGFARAAAERYPWITDWTPVNEPLTTARFSALYGHWHPHRRDEGAFWTALLNQLDAVRLGMAQIRAVNPQARLIQTEDLGRTYATSAVGHQADFDNARRWMTWDLLCGRVGREHPLWRRLVGLGFEDRLRAFLDAPCPPDVVGVNHYLTSDRFLDHRVANYPPERRGGNEFMAFADVEAIRVVLPAPGGLEGALDEAWTRYRLPLAVTECHSGCTREEQVRWLREGWAAANRARDRGVDVRALTVWALLGSYDWDSLLTRRDQHYEPGAFDVSGPKPRETAVGAEIRRLGRSRGPAHPATQGPGWWRRDIRLSYAPAFRSLETPEPRPAWDWPAAAQRPLLIVGATGTLGRAFGRACEWRGIIYRLASRQDLPLDDVDITEDVLASLRPWAVVNAAGWVRVDDAEADRAGCFAANTEAAARLADACARRGIAFVGFSSDLVFNGAASRPYVETDRPAPLNVYGASKAAAERQILNGGGRPLMVRTAAFFSPYDPHNFAAHVRRILAGGGTVEAADAVVSPTYVPDLVDATLDLLIDGETGLFHLANVGAVSWAGFARRLAEALGLDPGGVIQRPVAQFKWPAVRPPAVPLQSTRGRFMPSLESAIARYADIVLTGERDLDTASAGLRSDPARTPVA